MKKTIVSIAAALAILAAPVFAGTRIERTNVALANGVSADGFKLFGYGITSFAEAQYADEEFMGDNVVIMPEGVSAEDLEEVEAYLASIGITGYDVVCHDRGGDTRYDDLGNVVGKTADRCKW